jgi:3-oxoacyl-[acyl-carrier-protein] synthase III
VYIALGVEARRWRGSQETALDLAERACHALVARTGVDLGQIDSVLFCIQTPDLNLNRPETFL